MAEQVFGASFATSGFTTLTAAISATLPGVESEEGINDVTMDNEDVMTKDAPTLYRWTDVTITADMEHFDNLQKMITGKTRAQRKSDWTIVYPGVGTLTNFWARVRSVTPQDASTETNNHRFVCQAVIEFCGRDDSGDEQVPDFSAV